eukprot:9759175-Prorocentrum_lima.AAC.1
MEEEAEDPDPPIGDPEVPPAYDLAYDDEEPMPPPDEGPNSTLHLLAHPPKHPDCKVCQEAKAQRRPGRR